MITEHIGGERLRIEVPALSGSESRDFLYNLPTEQRGVVDIGPAQLSKSDPIGLFHRLIGQTGIEPLWVHPRSSLLRPASTGSAKDLDGPTYDDSPAGDVAFHALREYQLGDDYRHVHWLSTARKGQLMVRHYVDNRRPHVVVLVDCWRDVFDRASFEVAIEVGASIVSSALFEGRAVEMTVGDRSVTKSSHQDSVETVLDRLCTVAKTDSDYLAASAQLLAQTPGASLLIIVTGDRSAEQLLEIVQPARRSVEVAVVRVSANDAGVVLPRTRVFNVATLDEFVTKWDASVR